MSKLYSKMSYVDIVDSMDGVCSTGSLDGYNRDIFKKQLLRFSCDTVMKDWSETFERFLLKRETSDAKNLTTEFCGDGRELESVTMACFNVTLRDDFKNHDKKKMTELYHIWDPEAEAQKEWDKLPTSEKKRRWELHNKLEEEAKAERKRLKEEKKERKFQKNWERMSEEEQAAALAMYQHK